MTSANLKEYLLHYIQFPQVLIMLVLAIVVIGLSLLVIVIASQAMAKRYNPETRGFFIRDEITSLSERFYELTFSNTAILLFVSAYFMIDYFGIGASYREVWNKYNGVILLVFILTSILLTSLMDNLIIPLKNMRKGEQAAMRLMGMLYMLVVFAYIKYIYNDNNYDSIIIYFLTLVIGRFVYFDASLESFSSAMVETFKNLPLLLLSLVNTALMALYGFTSGYLIRSNGVVMNLFIAHLFLLLVIFLIHHTRILDRYGFRQARRSEVLSARRREEENFRPIDPEPVRPRLNRNFDNSLRQ